MNKGIVKRARTAFHTLDLFPLDMGFRENNSDKYTTWLGSLLSLLMLIVICYYGQKKFDIMINHDDTTYNEVSIDRRKP